jgi:dihydrofolate reductase
LAITRSVSPLDADAELRNHRTVSELRFEISVSVDGYVAGPNQGEEHPLGEGGEQLHDWVVKLQAWREPHGREGGEVNASSEVVERATENVGAVIMGRNMFGGGPGPWGEEPWTGWWGEEPPFHVPVFVLTHHDRESLELSDTTFHFVADGVESALQQAREAAGGEDVKLAGGAKAAQQYLAARLVDEIQLNIAPVVLGGGERLFENVGSDLELMQEQVVHTPEVTHVRYRVAR